MKNRPIGTVLLLLSLICQPLAALSAPCVKMSIPEMNRVEMNRLEIQKVESGNAHSGHDMGPGIATDNCHKAAPTACSPSAPADHECCSNDGVCPMTGLISASIIPGQNDIAIGKNQVIFTDLYSASFLSIVSPSLFRPPITL